MKKIIQFNLLLILIASINCCQSPSAKKEVEIEQQNVKKQQSDFNGILEFQINKTTIKALDTLKYKNKEISIKDGIEDQIEEMGILSVTDWDLLCEGVRKFKIIDFKKGTIEFSLVTLTFYKDTLIEFSSSVNFEMAEILEAKYPNYEFTYDDEYSHDDWYNQSIHARWSYNQKYGATFFIYDTDKAVEIMKKEDKAKADFLKKETTL